MTATLVNEAYNSADDVLDVEVTTSTTAGNFLYCQITAWASGDNPWTLSSVADSAGNTWTLGSVYGSYASAQSAWGGVAYAWCADAAATTHVTVTLSRDTYLEVAVYQLAGMPSGSGQLAVEPDDTLSGEVTAYTVPDITTSAAAAVFSNTSYFNSFTGVSSDWTLDPETDTAAYYLNAPPGTFNMEFSGGTASGGYVPSSYIVAFGAASGSTSAAAIGLTPAMAASGTVANPVTSTAALDFAPAMAAAGTVTAPVTSTAAMAFAPAVAASGAVPPTAAAAAAFAPAMAASGTVANPVISAAAIGFAPAMDGSGNAGITSAGAMSFTPSVNGSVSTTRQLFVAIAPAGGTDVYGNSYYGGISVYGTEGAHIDLALVDDNPVIFVTPQSLKYATLSGEIFENTNYPGESNEQMYMVLTSGKESGNADAGLQLFSESADGSIEAQIVFEFGGDVASTLTSGGFASDTWHTIGNPSGFSGTIRVKVLSLQNMAVLDVNSTLTSTSETGTGYTAGDLPGSGYYPASNRQFPVSVNQTFTTVNNASPRVAISSSGGVVFDMPGFEAAGESCIVSATVMYPLD